MVSVNAVFTADWDSRRLLGVLWPFTANFVCRAYGFRVSGARSARRGENIVGRRSCENVNAIPRTDSKF